MRSCIFFIVLRNESFTIWPTILGLFCTSVTMIFQGEFINISIARKNAGQSQKKYFDFVALKQILILIHSNLSHALTACKF